VYVTILFRASTISTPRGVIAAPKGIIWPPNRAASRVSVTRPSATTRTAWLRVDQTINSSTVPLAPATTNDAGILTASASFSSTLRSEELCAQTGDAK
jgi:hypothetical protein